MQLLASLHLSLQSCQSIQIAQGGASSLVLDCGSFLLARSCTLSGLLCLASFCTLSILIDAAMAQDNALALLVELDNLELQLLVELSLATVFLNKVLRSSKAFYTIFELDNCALVEHLNDSSLVDAVLSEYCLEYVPRILLQLLVAERETTVGLVDLQYANLDFGTNLSELTGVLDLLCLTEVAAVYRTFITFINLSI